MDEKEIAFRLAVLWTAARDDRETTTPRFHKFADERMFAYNVARKDLGISDESWDEAKSIVALDVCVEPGKG